jgi:hypothetical protein
MMPPAQFRRSSLDARDADAKKNMPVQVGFSLLLLAALTPSWTEPNMSDTTPKQQTFEDQSFGRTGFLEYAGRMSGGTTCCASTSELADAIDEELRKKKKKKLAAKAANGSSDDDKTDESRSTENGSFASQSDCTTDMLSVVAASTDSAPGLLPDDVMRHVLEFMPLQEVQRVRGVCGRWAAAAQEIAPTPLGATADAVFMRWTAPRVASKKSVCQWLCLACGQRATGTRRCDACFTPIATAACRVFLGQLRKERTTPLVHFVLGMLLPDVEVLHVESHTNAAGRGKGCAWVYLSSMDAAAAVVELHKRVFVDADADGREGVWYVARDELVPSLGAMAAECAAAARRLTVLPKQPLVAELPESLRGAALPAPPQRPARRNKNTAALKCVKEEAPQPQPWEGYGYDAAQWQYQCEQYAAYYGYVQEKQWHGAQQYSHDPYAATVSGNVADTAAM